MTPPVTVPADAKRFWCPWCQDVVEAAAYNHTHEHMDVAPYAVDVLHTFWPVGLAAHVATEGVTA